MSPTRVIGIVLIAGAILFALLLYYTLIDKVDDVSDNPSYAVLINKPLSLGRDALLIQNFKPLAKFAPNFMDERETVVEARTPLLYQLKEGTKITIHHFKSVKNGTSGSTAIYAIGKVQVPGVPNEIDFEYVWPREYSFLQEKYTRHLTPLWGPCPFDSNIKEQSINELKTSFKTVAWDSVTQFATTPLSNTETLLVSAGGCLRYNSTVVFETSVPVSITNLSFWNEIVNYIFENVFIEEEPRFRNALLENKLEYDSARSTEEKRFYTFIEPQTDTKNEYRGIVFSDDGKSRKMEISWYLDE